MRILVSCIPYDGGKSGISVYIREVVGALLSQGHELTLLVEPQPARRGRRAAPLPDAEGAPLEGLFASGGARPPAVRSAPRWTRRPALSMLWHLLFLPFWIRRHRRDFDGFAILAANRRVCAFYPLPTTATVHDLANFRIPGKYSRLRMFYLARILPFFAKRAQRLVAVSGATKADMVSFWHCRPEQVTVLYNGLTKCAPAAPQQPGQQDGADHPADASRPVGADLQSAPSSILYISRIEHPGKNHLRLIEAYSSLPPALAAAHPLVLAGADWKDAEVVHAAAARSPYASHIRFTGFVPDEAIGNLWASAGFYVFPSLFEGFGLSLAEAMARGIPCACSNNGSLMEIGEGVAQTFDPADPADIARAMRELMLEGPEERSARIRRGIERAATFSWGDHAAGIVRLLSSEGDNQ